MNEQNLTQKDREALQQIKQIFAQAKQGLGGLTQQEQFAQQLRDSYAHRHVADATCIACGRTDARLALHVVEFCHSDTTPTPAAFVAMSRSRGTTRGGVPLCTDCCPPCTRCRLPIATRWATSLLKELTASYPGITFNIGNGYCRHVHVLHALKALFRPVKLATTTRQEVRRAATAWPLMNAEEVHAFGIQVILPFLEKEGLAIHSVNPDPRTSPQVVGQRGGSLAFVFVRTALYPNKGVLTEAQRLQCWDWAVKHRATAYFASVGFACAKYPDKSPVTNDADAQRPIRGAGFAVDYKGLVVIDGARRTAAKVG
jgi:hypothetical protein